MFIFHILSSTSYFLWASFVDITRHARGRGQKTLECNLMNINLTLSHRRQMPVFVFGSNPNLRQCGGIYFDLSIPFGLRTGSLAMQRTTNAFVYMLRNRGIDCVGYIDDNAGANLPSMAESDFLVAGQLLQRLGLQESQKNLFFPHQIWFF